MYVCVYLLYCMILYIFTEFCANGYWGYYVPSHPGLCNLHSTTSKLCIRIITHHLMCILFNIGIVDVNIEAVSALSNAHQLNKCLVNNSTVECFINDGASDDRAVKCCISNHYHRNGRRRLVVVEATATNSKCTYLYQCIVNTYIHMYIASDHD